MSRSETNAKEYRIATNEEFEACGCDCTYSLLVGPRIVSSAC
jgi:hypothetical protein